MHFQGAGLWCPLLQAAVSKWYLAAAAASMDVEMSQPWILAVRSIPPSVRRKGYQAVRVVSSVSHLNQLFSCYLRCNADLQNEEASSDGVLSCKTATAQHVPLWSHKLKKQAEIFVCFPGTKNSITQMGIKPIFYCICPKFQPWTHFLHHKLLLSWKL